MVTTTRSRSGLVLFDEADTGRSIRRWQSTGEIFDLRYTPTVVTGRQETTSEGHPWPPKKGEGGDVGGEFFTKKNFVEHVSWERRVSALGQAQGTDFIYDGPTFAHSPHFPDFGSWTGMERNQLLSRGTTAIARTIPTNPTANTSVFLGELLREGLPSLIGAAALKHRGGSAIGGEFLNWEFGWKPFVSDLRNMAKAVTNSNRILKQLQRDSGRNVRRRYYFPIELRDVSNQFSSNALAWPGDSGYHYGSVPGASDKATAYEQSEVWFSGCYTYHFEMGDSTSNRLEVYAQKAEHLLGLELTPEVVWNLAPWSWLADWMSNIGDVFHNVSAFADDGLVLRHGYVMCRSRRWHEFTLTGLTVLKGIGNAQQRLKPLISRYGVEAKQRLRATPYGFGLDLNGFDLRQWAILGALGMTRAPKVLR